MTICIRGNEKVISLCISGEKCNVMESDGAHISTWFGTATVCTEEDSTKGKTIETIEKYDKDGKLVEKITREIPEDGGARICHTPWTTYGATVSSGKIACINNATQCASRARECAEKASECCAHAVSSVFTAKPSETYG